MNNSAVCNTSFTKKPVHKQTWQHPTTKKWHAIDFIIMHQRDPQLCQDCRVIVAADCDSYHRLVCASLKLPHTRFDHRPSTATHPRFDVRYMRPSLNLSAEEKRVAAERRENFQASITSALTTRQEGNEELETVEEQWCRLHDSLVSWRPTSWVCKTA